MANVIGDLLIKIGVRKKDADKSLAQLKTVFRNLGRVAVVTGAAIGVAIGASIFKFAKFEKAMRDVNSIAKLNEKQFQALTQEVLEFSKEVPQAPEVLARGLYDIQSAGFAGAQGMDILKTATRAAIAGVSDTATAARTVVSVLNAYGESGEKAAETSDFLFKAIELGQIRFSDLAQNVGQVAPMAAQVGISFQELMAAQAAMSKSNANMSVTSTQLRQLMFSLIKPSENLTKLYAKMGVTSGESIIKQKGLQGTLEAIEKAAKANGQSFKDLIVEKRGYMGVIALTGSKTRIFKDQLDKMSKAAGSTANAFAGQKKSLDFKISEVKSSITAVAITVGRNLNPALKDLIEVYLKPAIKQFGEWAAKLSKVLGIMGTTKVRILTAQIKEQTSIVEESIKKHSKLLNSRKATEEQIKSSARHVSDETEKLIKLNGQLSAAEEALTDLAATNTDKVAPSFKKVEDSIDGAGDSTKDLTTNLNVEKDKIRAYGQVAGQVFNELANSLVDANATYQEKMASLLKTGLNVILDIIAIQIRAYIAAETAKAVATGGITIGTVIATTAALAAVEGLRAAVGTISLAHGGLAYGSTAAIVGDNPNAATDPEVIAPLSKLQNIMNKSVNDNRSSMTFIINADGLTDADKITRDKIIPAIERYNKSKGRGIQYG